MNLYLEQKMEFVKMKEPYNWRCKVSPKSITILRLRFPTMVKVVVVMNQ